MPSCLSHSHSPQLNSLKWKIKLRGDDDVDEISSLFLTHVYFVYIKSAFGDSMCFVFLLYSLREIALLWVWVSLSYILVCSGWGMKLGVWKFSQQSTLCTQAIQYALENLLLQDFWNLWENFFFVEIKLFDDTRNKKKKKKKTLKKKSCYQEI